MIYTTRILKESSITSGLFAVINNNVPSTQAKPSKQFSNPCRVTPLSSSPFFLSVKIESISSITIILLFYNSSLSKK